MKLKELQAGLDISDIVETAYNAHIKKERSRAKTSQRIASLLPLGTVIAWVVSYALSAPHTASLFMLITPSVLEGVNLATFSPIVIEGFIAIISALRAYGVQGYKALMYSLMGLSISVNVIGGYIAITSADNLPNTSFLWLLASIPAGIIISFLSMVTGSIIVQFARGEIDLELSRGEGWQGLTRYNAIFEAIYNQAVKLGASPSQAKSLATKNAQAFCTDIAIDEQGTPYPLTDAVSQVAVASTSSNFAMASVDYDMTRHDATMTRQNSQNMGFSYMTLFDPSSPLESSNFNRDNANDATIATYPDYNTLANKSGYILGVLRDDPGLLELSSKTICERVFGYVTPPMLRTVQRVIKDMNED